MDLNVVSYQKNENILIKSKSIKNYFPPNLRIRPIASFNFSSDVAYESRIHPGA